MRRVRLLLCVACAIAAGSGVSAQHWPQFRGNQGLGVADEQRPRVSWDLETGPGVLNPEYTWGTALDVTSGREV